MVKNMEMAHISGPQEIHIQETFAKISDKG